MSLTIQSYPHIVEQILDYTLELDPAAVRGLTRRYKARAEAVLCAHIAITFGTLKIADGPSYFEDVSLSPATVYSERTMTIITGLFGARGGRVPGLRPNGSPAERAECARLLQYTKHIDILDHGTTPSYRTPGPFFDRDLLDAISPSLETVRGQTHLTPFSTQALILRGDMSTTQDSCFPPSSRLMSDYFPLASKLVLNVPGRDHSRGFTQARQMNAVRLPLQTRRPGSLLQSVIAHVYDDAGEPTRYDSARVLIDLLGVVGQTLTLDWTIVADEKLHLEHHDGIPRGVCEGLRDKIRVLAPGPFGEWGDYDTEEDFVEALAASVRIVTRTDYIAEVGEERYWCERGLFPPKEETVRSKRKRSGSPDEAKGEA